MQTMNSNTRIITIILGFLGLIIFFTCPLYYSGGTIEGVYYMNFEQIFGGGNFDSLFNERHFVRHLMFCVWLVGFAAVCISRIKWLTIIGILLSVPMYITIVISGTYYSASGLRFGTYLLILLTIASLIINLLPQSPNKTTTREENQTLED